MLFSYFSPVFAIANFNKQLVRNMAAIIQIKNDRINSFGGIFFIIDQFRSSGLAALVDKILGINGINTRYSYSNVIENLTSVFVSGGEVLEFYNQRCFGTHLQQAEQRFRVEAHTFLVYERKRCVHDTYGSYP